MATKAKSPTTPVAAPVAAPANPFAGLLVAPVAPGLSGVRALAAKVLAANPAGINSVGVALAALPPSLAAKGTACAWPVQVAATTYQLGAKLSLPGITPARAVHDVQCSLLVQSLGGTFTAAQAQAAGVPWHSMAAYLKRGWVVTA